MVGAEFAEARRIDQKGNFRPDFFQHGADFVKAFLFQQVQNHRPHRNGGFGFQGFQRLPPPGHSPDFIHLHIFR